MSIEQIPAPARSDVRHPAAAPASRPMTRPFFRHGTLLTIGASLWAASQVLVGVRAENADHLAWTYGVGSLVFQLGLLALLRVYDRTEALGSGRLARTVLRIEAVLVSLAIGSTISDTIGLTDFDRIGFVLLDATWPLSMLGMFLIGVRVAVAGRWQGKARFWPLVAESWVVLTLPTMGIFGEVPATVVSMAVLVLGYGVLGQLVARDRLHG